MSHLDAQFSPDLTVSTIAVQTVSAHDLPFLQGVYPHLFKTSPPMIRAATMLLAFDSSLLEGSFQHQGTRPSMCIPSER